MKCIKHKHDSRGAAMAHLRALEKVEAAENREPYFCPNCRHWHVGRPKAKAHKNKYRQKAG